MKVALRKESPVKTVAEDIDYALEDYPPEFGINLLSMLLGRYIVQSEEPLLNYSHSNKIILESISMLRKEINR